MKTQSVTVCVPVYDRPTDLADGEEICHACGQVYEPARDGNFENNFCWSCAPAIPEGDDLAWTAKDVQSTLTIVYDNEALAILRMAQV